MARRVMGLSDLKKDDDDEEADRQAYYAGGGPRSGINILDPSKRDQGAPNDLVRNILQQAHANATRGAGPSDPQQKGRLAAGDHDEEDDGADLDGDDEAMEAVTQHLTLWQDGFSIEDGPLHRYDDPASAALLAQIQSGKAPRDLFNVAFDQPIQISVAQRLGEAYKAPDSAAGHGSKRRTNAAAAAAAEENVKKTSISILPTFSIDASAPTTKILIRTADGERLPLVVNLSTTIAAIREHLALLDPVRPFTLHVQMPLRSLDDTQATVEEAGIKGAAILQKWEGSTA